jgi:hypothetical protein
MRELVIVFVLAAFLPLHAQESASKTGLPLYTYFDGLLNDTLRDPAKPKLINYPPLRILLKRAGNWAFRVCISIPRRMIYRID